MAALSALKPHQLLQQCLNFLLVLSTAYMLWKGLSVAADSKSPIVVVLSGSMEPAFRRGDLLFLWNRDGLVPPLSELLVSPLPLTFAASPQAAQVAAAQRRAARPRAPAAAAVRRKSIRVGEIVVYEVAGKEIPIVHRVVRRFGGCDGDTNATSGGGGAGCAAPATLLLTKGDNNMADDTELYARGQAHLDRDADVVGSVVGFVPFVGYGTILLSEKPWLKTAMLALMGVTVVLQRE